MRTLQTSHYADRDGEQSVNVVSKAERLVISVCVTSAMFTWGFWVLYAAANFAQRARNRGAVSEDLPRVPGARHRRSPQKASGV